MSKETLLVGGEEMADRETDGGSGKRRTGSWDSSEGEDKGGREYGSWVVN